LVVAMLMAVPNTALASTGTGVGAAPIAASRPVTAGQIYALPAVLVQNTGTEPARYHLAVQELGPSPHLPAPPSWVRFATNDLLLTPGQQARVPISLAVPATGAAGAYTSDIVVGTLPAAGGTPTGGAATVLGAQAATQLTFRVQSQTLGSPALSGSPRFPILLILAVLTAGGVVILWRRLGVSVRIERRRR
jgi:hypothetical protein